MRRLLLVTVLLLAAGCSDADDSLDGTVFAGPGDASADAMDEAAGVVRQRLGAVGVEDPAVEVDGTEVVVDVDDEVALDVVTAEPALAFRPVLGGEEGSYELGPAAIDGAAVEQAEALVQLGGEWSVELVLTEGGIDAFNDAAARCYRQDATCPQGRIAIELDGEVLSAPTVQAESFDRDDVVISGDFSELEARRLAAVLDSGPLPVPLERR